MGPSDEAGERPASSLSSSSSSSRASSVNSSDPGERGRKRMHADMEMECTGETHFHCALFKRKCFFLDSCDCEEFGQPLAKRINRMNIEHPISGQMNNSDNKRPLISINSENKRPRLSIEASSMSQPSAMPGSGPGSSQFCQNYPFPEDSPYFNNNLLLSKLYSERVSRNPHLKHDPT